MGPLLRRKNQPKNLPAWTRSSKLLLIQIASRLSRKHSKPCKKKSRRLACTLRLILKSQAARKLPRTTGFASLLKDHAKTRSPFIRAWDPRNKSQPALLLDLDGKK